MSGAEQKPHEKTVAASFLPVIVSLIVYPGAGQLMQRRWLAGAFFVLTSIPTAAWFMSVAFTACADAVDKALDGYVVPTTSVLAALRLPMAAVLLVYLVSSVDVIVAWWKLSRVARQSAAPTEA